MLKPEIKALWVEALRSGEYKQTKFQLRKDDSFCCLGVLCNLHAQAHPEFAAEQKNPEIYGEQRNFPPTVVEQWAFKSTTSSKDIHYAVVKLAQMNDKTASFKAIAKYIERRL